jgi:cell division protein FtsL
MSRRHSPVVRRSPLVPAFLALAIVTVGFFTLLERLEVTREGYRISAVRAEIARLEDQNRSLRLKVAELSSRERLRALAPKYDLAPPRDGQVVMMP